MKCLKISKIFFFSAQAQIFDARMEMKSFIMQFSKNIRIELTSLHTVLLKKIRAGSKIWIVNYMHVCEVATPFQNMLSAGGYFLLPLLRDTMSDTYRWPQNWRSLLDTSLNEPLGNDHCPTYSPNVTQKLEKRKENQAFLDTHVGISKAFLSYFNLTPLS